VKVREAIELIEADGWALVATRGSHRQFKHPTKPGLNLRYHLHTSRLNRRNCAQAFMHLLEVLLGEGSRAARGFRYSIRLGPACRVAWTPPRSENTP
jgi:hypothetical protein